MNDKYPWLDQGDERRNMSCKEILDKYVYISCLSDSGKKHVMDMLYKYNDALTLRDEIGICPNIEGEIDNTDKSSFFIRPYYAKEEDKNKLDKERKRLCYLGILKQGFTAYLSPVKLVSHKVTKHKRLVINFRHLNVTKNNLADSLLKEAFLVLGRSRCEVLLVLDLKDEFHSLRPLENSERFCGIFRYFSSASYLYQRMPMRLNISPSIWKTYLNAILDCLQSKKSCEAIMDNLLLLTPTKKSLKAKLEDLLKALLKNGLK